MKRLIAILMALAMLFGAFALVACKNNEEESTSTPNVDEVLKGHKDPKNYTYNDYLTLSPSNWNELTYQDENDTNIMSYIGSSFFGYDFKYDENGEILPGEFDIEYKAATKLEDVTAKYAADSKWGIPEGATARAWKITIREDLKWENGDPIKAEDFIYTMQEQLNPLFQNYRADSFYVGATIIHNAQAYAKQGQSGWFAADGPYAEYTTDLDSEIIFTLAPSSDEIPAENSFRGSMGFPASYDAAATAAYVIGNYLADSAFTAEAAAAMEGKTFAEIKADATLKAAWDALIGWWQTEPNEELDFFVTNYTYPECDWSDVGMFTDGEYGIVLVLDLALDLLKEDGSLSYKAAYNMSSLPLVHKATYEANKVAPTEGVDLWTTKYNTSVDTTMSWGPYKLESFQAGKQHVLVRNDNWYGYGVAENDDLYQTDRIVCDIVDDWQAAWVKFKAGEVDGIGIDVSIADEYKNSERAYFTPSDFVGSLQLQSDVAQLKARESDGINKSIMGYVDFRKALSLSINRADFTQKCTTASKAGFGLFNSMHYYDVANGGVFRNTDEAKQVLCNVYGVDASKYNSLDEAVDAITGYNLDLARELVDKAYAEAKAAGDIKDTDKVMITFGTGAITEPVERQFEYIKAAWQELVKGTALEGRLDMELKDFANAWANDFRAGAYDVCIGGWSGAAWDPGYFLLAYLDPGYMYSAAWDTTNTMMTFTMKGVGENGADVTETMGLLDWYACLNGAADAKYDWSATGLEESQRLQLIAALEEQVLSVYYSVPLQNSFSASMISFKVDYVTYEYNTFMGYGGITYMTYNFDDEGWAAEVAKNDGQLIYK